MFEKFIDSYSLKFYGEGKALTTYTPYREYKGSRSLNKNMMLSVFYDNHAKISKIINADLFDTIIKEFIKMPSGDWMARINNNGKIDDYILSFSEDTEFIIVRGESTVDNEFLHKIIYAEYSKKENFLIRLEVELENIKNHSNIRIIDIELESIGNNIYTYKEIHNNTESVNEFGELLSSIEIVMKVTLDENFLPSKVERDEYVTKITRSEDKFLVSIIEEYL